MLIYPGLTTWISVGDSFDLSAAVPLLKSFNFSFSKGFDCYHVPQHPPILVVI